MGDATIRAMLMQQFEHTDSDPELAHEMYHDDAVLEFPQSGERFVRGRDDLWVAEISISHDQRPWSFGVSILELRGAKISRESIYVTEGWEPAGVVGTAAGCAMAAAPRG